MDMGDLAVDPRRLAVYSDPATVLPREIVTEVLRLLNFAGRLAASHVCAAWRRIALADRRLWAQYRISLMFGAARRTAQKSRALVCLLDRSAPLPFRFECAANVPDVIVELVITHIRRMEVLYLGQFEADDTFRRLLALEIPTLKRISLFHAPKLRPGQDVRISATWASAPHLNSLDLGFRCFWPSNCSFPSVRSFSGFVPEVPGTHATLSSLFPNLTYLSLHRLNEQSVLPLDPLPKPLTVLKLRANSGVDCTALFSGRTDLTLRKLKIDSTRSASCVLEVFRLFARSVDGPWALDVYSGVIDLRAPPPRSGEATHRYDVFNIATTWLARSAEILAHCDALHTLRLGITEFSHFCAADAVLPALAAVTVFVGSLRDFGPALALRDSPGIHTPALRFVTVSLNARFDLDARVAAALNSVVRAFHSPRLSNVVIYGVRPETFRCENVQALVDLAERVEAQDSAGNVVHVFSPEAEGPPGTDRAASLQL